MTNIICEEKQLNAVQTPLDEDHLPAQVEQMGTADFW